MSHSLNSPVSVLIHPNQFPGAIAASLHESLRTRQMNHKFHYDTPKQTLRWLRLHEALSPARTDPDCFRIYESAFAGCVTELSDARDVEIVSLGCGGGQKDAQLLHQLKSELPGVRLRYVPVDVSSGLTLVAREAAIQTGVSPDDIFPTVVDLGEAKDWTAALESVLGTTGRRIVCFFGMLPNFIPGSVLPQLASLLRPGDILLLSANLSPGSDYRAGVEKILPLYDNALTRDWLWSVLLDLDVDREDASMEFTIVGDAESSPLLRIESTVTFSRDCQIQNAGNNYSYKAGETFRLFYSYRHTLGNLEALLKPHQIGVSASWSNGSGEEGVLLCVRR